MSRIANRDGFALPVTIFVVTILTLMLAALYVRVQADRVVAESTGDMMDALAIAQGGLQTYFSSTTTRPASGDSTRINVTGGYADVVVHTVQRPADTTLHQTFLVRSTGHVIVPNMGATPQASRTVAQFAEWQVGTMDPIGALTTANKLEEIKGGSGGGTVNIRGADQCVLGTAPPTAGIRTRNGSKWPSSGISGSPAILESGNGPAVAAETGIDWYSTLNGGLTPDYTTFTANLSYPVQIITGDLTVNNLWVVGSGVLVVTGNLHIQSFLFQWRGVVLVGGSLTYSRYFSFANSNFQFYGAVISGLNEQLGIKPPDSELGRVGTIVTIWHDSCEIRSALSPLTGLIAVRNGWVDNWATY